MAQGGYPKLPHHGVSRQKSSLRFVANVHDHADTIPQPNVPAMRRLAGFEEEHILYKVELKVQYIELETVYSERRQAASMARASFSSS